jgi:hypothetical protein
MEAPDLLAYSTLACRRKVHHGRLGQGAGNTSGARDVESFGDGVEILIEQVGVTVQGHSRRGNLSQSHVGTVLGLPVVSDPSPILRRPGSASSPDGIQASRFRDKKHRSCFCEANRDRRPQTLPHASDSVPSAQDSATARDGRALVLQSLSAGRRVRSVARALAAQPSDLGGSMPQRHGQSLARVSCRPPRTLGGAVAAALVLALPFLLAACGGSSGHHTQPQSPAQLAAKFNVQPADLPSSYRGERQSQSQILMLVVQDRVARCAGVPAPTSAEGFPSLKYVGPTVSTNGFLVSRVSVFPTADAAIDFLTAASRPKFAWCVETEMPAIFGALGIAAEETTFDPQAVAPAGQLSAAPAQSGIHGVYTFDWQAAIKLKRVPAADNQLRCYMFAQASMVVEVDDFRIGATSKIDETAERAYSVLLERTRSS